MKRILFMIPNLAHGGAEKVLVNLVNNMNKDIFDVTVMTLFDVGINKQFLQDNVRYLSCFKKQIRGNSHLLKLFSPKQLYKLFIKEDYDILVSYLEGPTARIVSGCTNKNTKLVSWIHCTPRSSAEFSVGFRSFKEARECYSKFSIHVCVSHGVEQAFKKFFDTNIPTKVLYNVNDSNKIIQLSNELHENIPFSQNEVNILGIGKIISVKGFDRLARIHKRLIDEGYHIHTYILGIGEDMNKIQNFVNENKMFDSFTFLGYTTNPYKFLKKSDLYVCSSYSEGFSTTTTEALIVGTAVISTNVSGAYEMLGENNQYGIVTDNNEESLYLGMKKVLDNQHLLNYYRDKSIERGYYFGMEKTLKNIEEELLR